jgi:hypothetical protein
MKDDELKSRAEACLEIFGSSEHVGTLGDFKIHDTKQAAGYYFIDTKGTRIKIFLEISTGKFLFAHSK